jgi:translocation and assembly module TamA
MARVFVLVLLLWSAPLWAAEPRLELEGGDEALRENVRAHVSLTGESCDLALWREQAVIRAAREEADRALRALGYYQAHFRIRIRRGPDCWRLWVRIEPGEPVRIKELDIRLQGAARQDPAFERLIKRSPLTEGGVARHDHYEQLKRGLARLARERGYFDSELEHSRLMIDTRSNEARVEIALASGPRYRFGAVETQQDVIREALMQRFVPFTPGDPFNNEALLTLRSELNASGYFSRVRIRVLTERADPDNRQVPVRVEAEPRPRYSFLVGAGYATDTGPRVRLGLENHRVNRRGHSYQLEAEASQVETGVGYNYRIPLREPNHEYINLSTSYVRDQTDTSFSERYRVGAARISRLDSDWVLTRSLEFQREYYTITDERDRADLIMPGVALSRTHVDDAAWPRLGWHLDGEIRGAGRDLGSSVSFGQFHGRAKGVVPLFAGRLLGRVELGTTAADELTELPVSVRFFAGGDNSVRGYDYEELGPTNEQGDVVGGRHLLTGTVEVDWPVVGRWSAAAFLDAGNAFDSFDAYEVYRGVGVGIRWRSPVGAIRVDVARPLRDRDSFRLHISMGSML